MAGLERIVIKTQKTKEPLKSPCLKLDIMKAVEGGRHEDIRHQH